MSLASSLQAVTKRNRLRAWSVIISFFGDAIVPRGGVVSAKAVQEVMHLLDIEPGAVRTAFSRLTRDGWVDREKIGRASFYRLSSGGLFPFEWAAERIYAAPNPTDDVWDEVIFAINNERPRDTVFLSGKSSQRVQDLVDDGYFIIKGLVSNIPDWLREELTPDELRQSYENLMGDFSDIGQPDQTPIEAMAARCLLLHEWRRLRLRSHDVPAQLLPKDWPEAACHQFVSDQYHKLLSNSEQWLTDNDAGPNGPLPQPSNGLQNRFR